MSLCMGMMSVFINQMINQYYAVDLQSNLARLCVTLMRCYDDCSNAVYVFIRRSCLT